MHRKCFHLTLAAMFGALAGCGQGADTAPAQIEHDPLLVQALNDQLMVDPDMSFQNEANAALTVNFDRSLPLMDLSAQAVAVARDEMRMQLLEGGAISDLPEPGRRPVLQGAGGRDLAVPCAAAAPMERSAIWAARLPVHALIPPRGKVTQATGTDRGGCKARLVSYLTPLGADEVMQYHFTLANRAGLKPSLLAGEKGTLEIRGERAGTRLVVRAQPTAGGLLQVDIASVVPDA